MVLFLLLLPLVFVMLLLYHCHYHHLLPCCYVNVFNTCHVYYFLTIIYIIVIIISMDGKFLWLFINDYVYIFSILL